MTYRNGKIKGTKASLYPYPKMDKIEQDYVEADLRVDESYENGYEDAKKEILDNLVNFYEIERQLILLQDKILRKKLESNEKQIKENKK